MQLCPAQMGAAPVVDSSGNRLCAVRLRLVGSAQSGSNLVAHADNFGGELAATFPRVWSFDTGAQAVRVVGSLDRREYGQLK